MADEGADVVRAFFAASTERDAERMRALLDPDVEWHNTKELPDGGIRHGPDAVERTLREQADAFEHFRAEMEELRMAGEQVYVVARLRGRIKGSNAELDARVGQIWTVRDGRIARFRPFFDVTEAQRLAQEETRR